MATATDRAKPPLCARGHAAACVGEEAAGAGAGSRCSAMTRASCWTRSRVRRRREEDGVQHKQPLDAATALKAHAQARHCCGHHMHWHVAGEMGSNLLSTGKFIQGRSQLRW